MRFPFPFVEREKKNKGTIPKKKKEIEKKEGTHVCELEEKSVKEFTDPHTAESMSETFPIVGFAKTECAY